MRLNQFLLHNEIKLGSNFKLNFSLQLFIINIFADYKIKSYSKLVRT